MLKRSTRSALFFTPSQDLFAPVVEKISEFIKNFQSTDQFLAEFNKQIEIRLKHIHLELKRDDPSYIHPIAYKGPYPFRVTFSILKSVLTFFLACEEQISQNPLKNREFDKEAIQQSPRQSEEELRHNLEVLHQEHTLFVKKIIEKPLFYYEQFKEIIQQQGLNAPFEVFSPVIEFLALSLLKESHPNPASQMVRSQLLQEIKTIREKGYPYLDTIDLIETALGYFDVCYRANPQDDPIPELFHSYRYQYYSAYLKGEVPTLFLFPTIADLGATDLLKIRGVPLAFLGVNTSPAWVDGFAQTPLEFWFHDVNHNRRMWQYFQQEAIRQKKSITEWIQISHHYVDQHLIPLIVIQKEDSRGVIAEKQLIKIILFEILHEFAYSACPSTIHHALISPPGDWTEAESIEGNQVEYFMEKSGAKLALVYWKLIANFYDKIDGRHNYIVDQNYRTKQWVIRAAIRLAERLNFPALDEPTLREYLEF